MKQRVGRLDEPEAGAPITPIERRAALSLSGIYALRMAGLFMIFPVFVLYAHQLDHMTPTLVGVALGVYGLTQALLQIPFGMLSDRWGRKPIIAAGLVLFALGSFLAASADTIGMMILGRALQGAGAVAAAVMALLADLTRETHRTKAMAAIGLSIGLAFALGMVMGPVLNRWIGVPGIFALTGGLALGGLGILYWGVPNPVRQRPHHDAEAMPDQFGRVLADGQLVRLYVGILVLHLVLTASFVALPLALRDVAGLAEAQHWLVYLPVMALSVLGMLPLVVLAERRRRIKPVMLAAIGLLAAAELGLSAFHASLTTLVVLLWVFFVAFNALEAILPSLVSKVAPAQSKGTALGVYSTAQFLGAFLGGTLGGWLYGRFGLGAVFELTGAAALLWLAVASTMRRPHYLTSYLLNVGEVSAADAERLARQLTAVRGVAEAVVVAKDGVAYLKVDGRALDEAALREFSEAEA